MIITFVQLPVLLVAQAASTESSPPPTDHRPSTGLVTELPIPPEATATTKPPPPVHRIALDPRNTGLPPVQAIRARAAIDRGLRWLLDHQDESGGWGGGAMTTPTNDPDAPPSPAAAAITGLGIKAVAQAGLPNPKVLARAIHRLRLASREDFGYDDGPISNYVIAAITSGLASLDDPAYHELVQAGVESLRRHQWDAGEGYRIEQDWYGGAGYGTRGRPDLSNTQFMIEALYDAGVPADDEAIQRAVIFLSRCQNLNATNAAEWAGVDGGFVYTSANGGESMASQAAGFGLRGNENLPPGTARSLKSYGSMTYAGYKSLLYAGLAEDDPRVLAALDWIRANFTLASNPGLGQQGYYYYLSVMSRALRASNQEVITAPGGRRYNWRAELSRALLNRQQDDGSWINESDRWLEGRRDLATIYALLALEEVLKPIRSPTSQQDSTTP